MLETRVCAVTIKDFAQANSSIHTELSDSGGDALEPARTTTFSKRHFTCNLANTYLRLTICQRPQVGTSFDNFSLFTVSGRLYKFCVTVI